MPQSTSDVAGDKPFRFVDLPAELRNWTYGLAFEDAALEIDKYLDADTKKTQWIVSYYDSGMRQPTLPALLRVNKQLRSEALHVLYSKARFILESEGDLSVWIRGLKNTYRKAINHVQISSLSIPPPSPERTAPVDWANKEERQKVVAGRAARGLRCALAVHGIALYRFQVELDMDRMVMVCRKVDNEGKIVVVE